MFVGTDTSFEVVVSGEPAPMVEWFLDDHLIRNDKRHLVVCHGAVHSLTITDIQIEDEGIYQCVATNAAGEATSDCELLIDGELKTHNLLQIVHMREQMHVVLHPAVNN